MPLHRDNSDRNGGDDKRTFKLINAAISISVAIVLSALLLSIMLTKMAP